MSIIIYSNKIKTGKSTSLLNWCKQQNKPINGFIMLEENNQKITYLANNLKPYKFNYSHKQITIGNYTFNENLFIEGNILAETYLLNNEFSIFCLDEIGKLELNNQGWHKIFKKVLAHEKENKTKLYLFIVRDYLLQEVINSYKIADFKIINTLQNLTY